MAHEPDWNLDEKKDWFKKEVEKEEEKLKEEMREIEEDWRKEREIDIEFPDEDKAPEPKTE